MSDLTLTIEPLGAHPDLVELTCEWHVPEFDPGGDMDFWLRARRREATLEGVPCAWIAFENDVPVGSVSLIEHNMERPGETSRPGSPPCSFFPTVEDEASERFWSNVANGKRRVWTSTLSTCSLRPRSASIDAWGGTS